MLYGHQTIGRTLPRLRSQCEMSAESVANLATSALRAGAEFAPPPAPDRLADIDGMPTRAVRRALAPPRASGR